MGHEGLAPWPGVPTLLLDLGLWPPVSGVFQTSTLWLENLRCGLAVGAPSPVSPLSWLRGICVLVAGSRGEGEGGLRDSFLNFGFLVCELC